MPMVPEAVIAMLACARLGAIHSVVFGGFAANELATRIEDAKPKVIVSASCGIEPGRLVEYKPLLDAAIGMVESKPERCIVLQRPMLEAMLDPDRDVEWNAALAGATPAACASVDATDPLYILYTSGTTGQPKGIVRDNGGHAVALAWTMKNIYDVDPGEVYWAASDLGWTIAHQAGAGLGPSGGRRRRHRAPARRNWRARPQAAASARLLTDAVERRRSLPRHLPLELSRVLRDGRRRLHRRERLRLRDGSHR